jgi:hypothetical protein
MAIPGLVAASNLADAENKEAVWDNLGNGIEAAILATNFVSNNTMVGAVTGIPGTPPTGWILSGGGLDREIIGTGVEDGINYIDIKYSGTSITGLTVVNFENFGQVIASQGQTWTESAFVKLQSGSFVNTSTTISLLANDGTTGLQIFVSPVITSTPSKLEDCRFSVSGTFTNSRTNNVMPRVRIAHTIGSVVDITLRIGAPQLEQGEYLTPPIPTTNAPASALATVSLAIKGDDILELTGARLASTSDFVRIKGLTTLAQPRLTAAAASVGSGTALRDNALLKVSPSSEGDYFLSRGTLDGQSLRVNGLSVASLSGSPFSGSTASCPLLISSFAAPTNLRINNAMASGTLAFPERAIPIETDQFIFYAKAGQS